MSHPLRRYSITDRNGRRRRKSEFFFCPRRLLFIDISDHRFLMMTDRSRILILKERSDLIELELSLNDSMLMLMLLSKISSLYDFIYLLLHFIALKRVVCDQRVERITVNIVSGYGAHLFMNGKMMPLIRKLTEMELITQLAGKFAEEQGAFKLLVRPLKFSLDQGKSN
jgi:hypothetical protein